MQRDLWTSKNARFLGSKHDCKAIRSFQGERHEEAVIEKILITSSHVVRCFAASSSICFSVRQRPHACS
jgi:hypothetical protein